MKKDLKNPEVAPKVKALRKHEGDTQADIAELIGVDEQTIKRIEQGKSEHGDSRLNIILKHYDVVDLPFKDEDRLPYVKRLHRYGETIASGLIEDAKALQKDLHRTLKAESFDLELSLLYRLPTVDLLIQQGKSLEARKEMLSSKKNIDKMSPRLLYHYYHNEGLLYSRDLNYKEAIKFFKKADEISENNPELPLIFKLRATSNIGRCYTELAYPFAGIVFLENALEKNEDSGLALFNFNVNLTLSLNYSRVGVIIRAKELLGKALDYAQSVDNKFYIGLVHYNYGRMHNTLESWEEGKESLDKAIDILGEGSPYHMWSCCYKIECMIGNREFKSAEKMIEEVESMYPDDKHAIKRLGLLKSTHSISKGITQPKDKDVEYLLNKAIPDLIDNHFISDAIKIYELLAEHFERTNQRMRAGEMYKRLNELRKSLSAKIQ